MIYFVIQSAFFMNEQKESIEAIQDIKRMMERSSRFISLSGLSGVGAGVCALVGAALAWPYIYAGKEMLNVSTKEKLDQLKEFIFSLSMCVYENDTDVYSI